MVRRTSASFAVAALAIASFAAAAPVAAKEAGPPRAQVAKAAAKFTAAMRSAGAPATLERKSITDPTGDVDDARADITKVSVRYTAHTLELSATIPGGTDPRTDSMWQSPYGYTQLAFAIDIGDVSYPEYIAAMAGGPRGTILAGLNRDFYEFPPGYGEQCNGVTGTYADHVYTIRVPADCMTNPAEVRVTAGMVIYENANLPFPIDNPPIVDVAPDHGPLEVAGVPGGYVMVSDTGSAFSFGSYAFKGSIGPVGLAQPIVDAAGTRNGRGYLMLGADGGVFRFGNAPFAGSAAGAVETFDTAMALALTPSGKGYWIVTARGAVFNFGDARMWGNALPYVGNSGIVDIVPTATGRGYWLVARDGAVFAFGDARFRGSAFALGIREPIVSMAATATGNGSWLIGANGGVFAFGDARFLGSTGGLRLVSPITDVAVTPTGRGYTLFAEDGGVFRFGDARWYGSAARYFGRGRIVAASAF
jgi:hypothetical protein